MVRGEEVGSRRRSRTAPGTANLPIASRSRVTVWRRARTPLLEPRIIAAAAVLTQSAQAGGTFAAASPRRSQDPLPSGRLSIVRSLRDERNLPRLLKTSARHLASVRRRLDACSRNLLLKGDPASVRRAHSLEETAQSGVFRWQDRCSDHGNGQTARLAGAAAPNSYAPAQRTRRKAIHRFGRG